MGTPSNERSNNRTALAPILVVEDDTAIRQVIVEVLHDEDLPVVAAEDGEQALAWLLQHQPSLILLDMNLPIIDGPSVAAGARAFYDNTVPIVTMTANGSGSEKARRVDGDAFLRKPFDLEVLLETVQSLLEAL